VFSKILVANRGEIAVRIVRACAEMDIKSVAIYSDADRSALHVKKADEAYNLGPDPVGGYLNAHRIVNLAVTAGCDALHPGYGFLSENPELAEICARRGVTFIGPSPEVIRAMGDKIEARRSMIAAGIPVVPGSDGNLKDVEEAAQLARKVGYPVMLKATSGGGGRGIRRCDSEADLRRAYERVVSEASKAFGRADVFLEKAVVNPRHIEVQILGDRHGNVIHLFERDCSIQRRHQKLVEIAPSPQLSEEQRAYVCGLAVRAAKAVGYQNAGTVEFLMDQDRRLHFIEMNTRIQVEHPVTEMVTDVDLVKSQIMIAAGARMTEVLQGPVIHRGHAIECRINAEHPEKFTPSAGKITTFNPPGGTGVRIDTAAYSEATIPPYYDSLIAKLIVRGKDRNEAISRMARALEMFIVQGIHTTIPLHRRILADPEFRAGNFDTGFIERFLAKKMGTNS